MIQKILFAYFLVIYSPFIYSQFCLRNALLTNADPNGTWQVTSQPIGESLSLQFSGDNPCIKKQSLSPGPYNLIYVVDTDCCSDTAYASFYILDLEEIEVENITVCNAAVPFFLTQEFTTFQSGLDAICTVVSDADGIIPNNDLTQVKYNPSQDTTGENNTVTITCIPQIPSGYIPFSEVNITVYSFDIYINPFCGYTGDGDPPPDSTDMIDCATIASFANAGTDATICQNETCQLSASGGATYSWAPSTTLSNPSISNPISFSEDTITYVVTVVDNNGCSDTDQVTVNVKPVSQASISGTNTICTGASTTLTASTGSSYIWNTGETIQAINPTPNEGVSKYIVTVRNANQCNSTASINVTTGSLEAQANVAAAICQGDSAQLSITSGLSYQWAPSTGLSATNIRKPKASPDSTKEYSVTVTFEGGCTAWDNVTVNVYDPPVFTPPNDITICKYESTQLTSGPSGTLEYTWSPSQGLNITDQPIVIASPLDTTTYYITAHDPIGCTTTDSVIVYIDGIKPRVFIETSP